MMSFKHIYISLLLLSTLCGVFLYVLHERTLVTQEVKTSVVPPPPPTPTPPKATTTPKVVMPAEEWLEKTINALRVTGFSTSKLLIKSDFEIIHSIRNCEVSALIFPGGSVNPAFAYFANGDVVKFWVGNSPNSQSSIDSALSSSLCTPPILVHRLPWTPDSCDPSDMCI